MPEGHTIHRAARDHRRMIKGQSVAIASPQGRFADGASILDARICETVEAYGKHLIYAFAGGAWMHVHLGLFGRIRTAKVPGAEPRGAVRVRMISKTHVIDINGPTICEVLDLDGFQHVTSRIGPDVLRKDADVDKAFDRISRSKAPIGRLLMDQSVIAGIGNIYRTELLWRQGVHPDTPGRALDRDAFDALWHDAVHLLEIGVKRNAIITVDDAAPSKLRYRERTNIFAKDTCPRCHGTVEKIEIAKRRAFVCETCQPPGALT